MKTIIGIYPFNERGDVNNVKGSKVSMLADKINNGIKLSRDEKDWITESCQSNSYSKVGVPVMGVMFNFKSILTLYIVRQYGAVCEYYAIDKTSLRKSIGGKIDYIKQLQ